MYTYLYDGTFDGLLTVYFYAYKDSEIYEICPQALYQPSLHTIPKHISTQPDKAERIRKSVYTKLSSTVMYNLYLLYLSELPDCNLLGLQYLRLCYSRGIIIHTAKQHPVMRQVEDYRYKVTRELDRMKGFLRFQKIDKNVYYAKFAPDHNQLPLLKSHLEKRFSDQKWIVHDERRSCALIYNLDRSMLVPFSKEDAQKLLAGKEDDYIALFQRYFHTISIKERTNKRLQDNYMPKRYREHMPETQ